MIDFLLEVRIKKKPMPLPVSYVLTSPKTPFSYRLGCHYPNLSRGRTTRSGNLTSNTSKYSIKNLKTPSQNRGWAAKKTETENFISRSKGHHKPLFFLKKKIQLTCFLLRARLLLQRHLFCIFYGYQEGQTRIHSRI